MTDICELKTMDKTKNFKSIASENRGSESRGFFYSILQTLTQCWTNSQMQKYTCKWVYDSLKLICFAC